MDAVYGALVGVAGTVLGSSLTWLQLRTQAKATNSQWRRQMQRDAYGAVLQQVDILRKCFEPIGRRAREAGSTAEDFAQLEAVRVASIEEIDGAIIVVALEGPDELSNLAFEVGHAMRAWGEALQVLTKAVVEGEADLHDKKAIEATTAMATGELVATFILTARKHLDRA
ncbi:hypothetical protein ACIRD0_31625 [Streptomyces microflavus]|uniref:hypothetical protein n=1 Tax=Streptomyces microflavus TaxID=1919 RepID=UPI0038081DEA